MLGNVKSEQLSAWQRFLPNCGAGGIDSYQSIRTPSFSLRSGERGVSECVSFNDRSRCQQLLGMLLKTPPRMNQSESNSRVECKVCYSERFHINKIRAKLISSLAAYTAPFTISATWLDLALKIAHIELNWQTAAVLPAQALGFSYNAS